MMRELTQPASMHMLKMLTSVVVSLWGSCRLLSHTVRSHGPTLGRKCKVEAGHMLLPGKGSVGKEVEADCLKSVCESEREMQGIYHGSEGGPSR